MTQTSQRYVHPPTASTECTACTPRLAWRGALSLSGPRGSPITRPIALRQPRSQALVVDTTSLVDRPLAPFPPGREAQLPGVVEEGSSTGTAGVQCLDSIRSSSRALLRLGGWTSTPPTCSGSQTRASTDHACPRTTLSTFLYVSCNIYYLLLSPCCSQSPLTSCSAHSGPPSSGADAIAPSPSVCTRTTAGDGPCSTFCAGPIAKILGH